MLGVQALGRRRARAGRAWAAQGRVGLGRWARVGRHGRRAWALGMARRQACVGVGRGAQAGVRGSAGRRRQEVAARERSGRAAGRAAGVGARVRGAGGSGRAAGRTGARRWADWALGAGARGLRGRGRQRARHWQAGRAPGVLAGQVGGSCTRLDFQTGFSTRYFSRVTK